ncbi:prephenate dehydrogenase [Catenibacillus scindens]|uniref:prephenate dehydrogenase n=1 Tax=Catenibacillus scindens TaxID=673271 RepID=UPI0032099276
MTITTIGFAGLGLIGGSIAKALRRVRSDLNIIAFDPDRDSLTAALADGTLNQAHDTLSQGFSQCDIIFLCAPVKINIQNLQLLAQVASPRCIFTDVGSVKSPIDQAVHTMGLSSRFIGGHPMAGSEKSGYASANDRLLENAYYILTPTPDVPRNAVEAMTELAAAISAIPVLLDANRHDFISAAISHLPHMIAYALVNLVRDQDDHQQHMRMLAAGGFKDITRIASSSPVMWQQICGENKENLLKIMDTYIQSLQELSLDIKNGADDQLLDFFSQAKDYRDAIPKTNAKGSLAPLYEIYVDIIDESGAIATIATILATNGISIKNIGIIHNREFQEGALRIEFYENDAAQKAIDHLRKFHYTVYERN